MINFVVVPVWRSASLFRRGFCTVLSCMVQLTSTICFCSAYTGRSALSIRLRMKILGKSNIFDYCIMEDPRQQNFTVKLFSCIKLIEMWK